jgi:hypothetical protein
MQNACVLTFFGPAPGGSEAPGRSAKGPLWAFRGPPPGASGTNRRKNRRISSVDFAVESGARRHGCHQTIQIRIVRRHGSHQTIQTRTVREQKYKFEFWLIWDRLSAKSLLGLDPVSNLERSGFQVCRWGNGGFHAAVPVQRLEPDNRKITRASAANGDAAPRRSDTNHIVSRAKWPHRAWSSIGLIVEFTCAKLQPNTGMRDTPHSGVSSINTADMSEGRAKKHKLKHNLKFVL